RVLPSLSLHDALPICARSLVGRAVPLPQFAVGLDEVPLAAVALEPAFVLAAVVLEEVADGPESERLIDGVGQIAHGRGEEQVRRSEEHTSELQSRVDL